jgi:hypothetical protein
MSSVLQRLRGDLPLALKNKLLGRLALLVPSLAIAMTLCLSYQEPAFGFARGFGGGRGFAGAFHGFGGGFRGFARSRPGFGGVCRGYGGGFNRAARRASSGFKAGWPATVLSTRREPVFLGRADLAGWLAFTPGCAAGSLGSMPA